MRQSEQASITSVSFTLKRPALAVTLSIAVPLGSEATHYIDHSYLIVASGSRG